MSHPLQVKFSAHPRFDASLIGKEGITNGNFALVKPPGGFWTSAFDPVYGSGWAQWCLAEKFDGTGVSVCRCYHDSDREPNHQCFAPRFTGWILRPHADARILHLDGHDDLEGLHAAYPRCFGPYATLLSPGRHGSFCSIDWVRVSQDYDAVHLTHAGQWATRMTSPLSLYGWDCESTVWFRPVLECVGLLLDARMVEDWDFDPDPHPEPAFESV